MESKLFWGARAVIRKLGFFCLGLRRMITFSLRSAQDDYFLLKSAQDDCFWF